MTTKRLRELLVAATPGPWTLGDMHFDSRILKGDLILVDDARLRDSALIVEMRNSLPTLLDRLDKLEAVTEAVQASQAYKNGICSIRTVKAIQALAALDSEKP